jgi:hypothetical protein
MVGFDQCSAVRTQMSLGAEDFGILPKAFVVMVNGKQIHRHYTALQRQSFEIDLFEKHTATVIDKYPG